MRRIASVWLGLLLVVACERNEPSAEPTAVGSERTPTSNGPPKPAPDEPSAAEPEPEPAGPSPQEQAAMALLQTVEALGELHLSRAHDCAGLATALEGFHRDHGKDLAEADAETLAWIDAHDEARTRMSAAMGSVMTASMRCRDDAQFGAVQDRLFGASAK
ncbi:hypothetical protein [Paraliomyxa miuraensis]|uniref:hypothetical protein n=1 Tax=Paraliomyxa miuraensis TaxID=376150 RepID=UPI002258C6EF|nr:hypothetical protein [Paraliomyxa miuraensis]MCX4240553.1 hypothetical protein [Paraliomyxa miuraensis]